MQALLRARSLLLGSTMLLSAVGVVMIYSASAIYAQDTMGDSEYFLKRHLMYLLLGGWLAYWASTCELETLRRHSKTFLAVMTVLLVLVLIPGVGHATKGARRWFKFLGFSFQPSEFLKLVLILYFADYLERKRPEIQSFKRTLVPALVVTGVTAGLVFLQPDLGTAVTVAATAMLLFFAAGVPWMHLAGVVLAALPGLAWAMLAKPYRRKRLLAFFDPWDDPRGTGFQIIQSFLALGSGGIFGVGLGKSQQKLFYLPESHTDFIFSIIGEELGFVGAGSVLILFLVFLFAGMVIVIRSKGVFDQLFGLGIIGLIGLEVVINIGVSLGALPTKGLSLPFISYGGSTLIVNLVAVGFMVNLARRAQLHALQS